MQVYEAIDNHKHSKLDQALSLSEEHRERNDPDRIQQEENGKRINGHAQ
jgi:hypothetical protein